MISSNFIRTIKPLRIWSLNLHGVRVRYVYAVGMNSGVQLQFYRCMKIGLIKWDYYCVQDFYSDFKNKYWKEFKDNSKKLCRWSRKRVSHEIDETAG